MNVCSIDGCSVKIYAKGYCLSHYDRNRKYGDPLAGKTRRGAPMEWVRGALGSQEEGCILWPFLVNQWGYGRLRKDGRMVMMHRLICEIAHGEPPSEYFQAAHKCGNTRCGNPKHLRWATPKQNSRDKIAHGTMCNGSRSPSAKLNEQDVVNIRRRHANGERVGALARTFKVTSTSISRIVSRKKWKHVA